MLLVALINTPASLFVNPKVGGALQSNLNYFGLCILYLDSLNKFEIRICHVHTPNDIVVQLHSSYKFGLICFYFRSAVWQSYANRGKNCLAD